CRDGWRSGASRGCSSARPWCAQSPARWWRWHFSRPGSRPRPGRRRSVSLRCVRKPEQRRETLRCLACQQRLLSLERRRLAALPPVGAVLLVALLARLFILVVARFVVVLGL